MDNPYHCEHEETELRKRTFSNGTTHYVEQCLRCGAQLKAYKHDSNEVAQAKLNGNIIQFDNQISHDFFKLGLTERQEQLTDKKAEWDTWYSEYLKSPAWSKKRTEVLRRDQHICQGCRERRATEVHHLSYSHAGDELLFQLISLCGRCHEKVHNERNVTIRATVPR